MITPFDIHAKSRVVRPMPGIEQPVMLEVDGVTLQYASGTDLVTATWRVSFNVHYADRFILLGPSGCGKSTLLKAAAGFMSPVEGAIRLRGTPVKRPGPDRMMVFQEFDQLFPWRTVRENVIKQRAAIARALAMEPDVLLMDEPFAALDALTRRRLQDELLRLWDTLRFTMLFVTHGIDEATRIGSRILVLSPHPGQVRAELSCPDDWDTSQRLALEQKITTMLLEEKAHAEVEA